MERDTVQAEVEAVLSRADRLDRAGLLRLAAGPVPRARLEAARHRANESIGRAGLDRELERVHGEVVTWSFLDGARARAYAIVPPINGDVQLADLRSEAAPALLDALLATILGPRLDPADTDLLLAAWRGATDDADEHAPARVEGRPVHVGELRAASPNQGRVVFAIGLLIVLALLLVGTYPVMPDLAIQAILFLTVIVVVAAWLRRQAVRTPGAGGDPDGFERRKGP